MSEKKTEIEVKVETEAKNGAGDELKVEISFWYERFSK